MRVLHVIPGLASRTGGPVPYVLESSLALAAHGIQTTTFATDIGHAASAGRLQRIAPGELLEVAARLDVRLFPVRPPHRLTFSPALYRALAHEVGRYDVVHVHSLFLFPQFAVHRQAARRGVPYVVSPHGSLDPVLRGRGRLRKGVTDLLWQRTFLERAAALHLTTDEEARLVADIAPSVPRAVVPVGIHWEHFQNLPSPDRFRQTFLAGHAGPVVLNLGRISYKKGLDLLIRAFSLVSTRVDDAVLVLAGPDDEGLRPQLAGLAERAGVAERVVFTGMLRGADRLGALAAADVWALPSQTENFGIAVVEALAAGCATLVSPAVNLAPELERAGAAIVCRNDEHEFAEAIVRLLEDDAGRRALGERGREFARRYDWPRVAPGLAALYAGVVSRG